MRNNPIGLVDPNGLVVLNAAGLPPGAAADIILAIQDLESKLKYDPQCDCYFRQHGGRTLSDLLNDPTIYIYYNPHQERTPNGQIVHGKTLPWNQPDALWLYPISISQGQYDIESTIVHELLHLDYNPTFPYGTNAEPEADKASEICVPFSFQITVSAKP